MSPLCLCLSEETLKTVGHFYLVSVPGEVKDLTSHEPLHNVVQLILLATVPHKRIQQNENLSAKELGTTPLPSLLDG